MLSALSDLLHLVYTPTCCSCGRVLVGEGGGLCAACRLELPLASFAGREGNPAELRLTGRVPFEAATALLLFHQGNVAQTVLHQIKYYGNRPMAHAMGRMLGQELAACHRFDTVDLLLPVPLHRAKLRQRGYNQSLLLCQGIAEVYPRPICSGNLVRHRSTDSQTHLSRSERLSNMQGVFRTRRPERLRGKHVLLVDDVMTSGATLEACYEALRQVPDLRFSYATLALAGTA